MTILHIANLSNKRENGINVVVPKHVYYQSKYTNTALLNLSDYNYENQDIKVFNRIEINKLDEPFNRPDLVIFHGIYFLNYIKIAKNLKNILYHCSSWLVIKNSNKTDFFKFIKRLPRIF